MERVRIDELKFEAREREPETFRVQGQQAKAGTCHFSCRRSDHSQTRQGWGLRGRWNVSNGRPRTSTSGCQRGFCLIASPFAPVERVSVSTTIMQVDCLGPDGGPSTSRIESSGGLGLELIMSINHPMKAHRANYRRLDWVSPLRSS